MPKTDINTILKHGSSSKAQKVDFTTKKAELRDLKTKNENILKNKEVSVQRLNSFVIKK